MSSGDHGISWSLVAFAVTLAIGCIQLSLAWPGANYRPQNMRQLSDNRPQIDQYLHARRKRDTSSGTTQNLEYIFRGRCFQYAQVINNLNVDCNQLWSLFKASVTSGPYCGVHNYTSFVVASLSYLDNSDKQFVFWSKTKPLTSQYTFKGTRKYALADTLVGYLLDDLQFCGANGSFNFTNCPRLSDCNFSDDAFWAEASRQFARRAPPQYGGVIVILNGSLANFPSDTAYSTLTYFYKYELPNMAKNYNIAPNQLTINVWLAQNFGAVKERCAANSLVDLEKDVKSYGYQYACFNNPPQLAHLLCVDDYKRPECTLSNSAMPTSVLSFGVLIITMFVNYLSTTLQ